MDDTSIQFRLRMAQINGIKLHEANTLDEESDSGIQIKTPIHSGTNSYLRKVHERMGRDKYDMHELQHWSDGKRTVTFVPKGEGHPYDKIK